MSEATPKDLLIGTSGFSYPDWKGVFYPASLPSRRWLEYYAGRFGAVEVNLTFYRPASAATLARWRDAVPADFAFTFKASRTITHDKKLIDCHAELETFVQGLDPLGERATSMLFQLPPSLTVDVDRLSAFLETAAGVFDSTSFPPRPAIEFRHPSWYCAETFALLRRHGWSVVVHDMMKAGGWNAVGESLAAGGERWSFDEFLGREVPSLYLRFHGPTGRYRGGYGERNLKRWALLARAARARELPVLVYFNNTVAAAAVRDAEIFAGLLGDRPTVEQAVPWRLSSD
jgi:uncharacterized protein YecE (DUF72 family)